MKMKISSPEFICALCASRQQGAPALDLGRSEIIRFREEAYDLVAAKPQKQPSIPALLDLLVARRIGERNVEPSAGNRDGDEHGIKSCEIELERMPPVANPGRLEVVPIKVRYGARDLCLPDPGNHANACGWVESVPNPALNEGRGTKVNKATKIETAFLPDDSTERPGSSRTRKLAKKKSQSKASHHPARL
jgi:hypothetical protein